MALLVAVAAGLLIGVSLGAVGGGGSILAVPVLAFGLGQSAVQATTGSLVVVGTTAVVGAVAAWRTGRVRVAQGLVFGLLALAGTTLGALGAQQVPEPVLMGAFTVVMLVVAGLMVQRQFRKESANSRGTKIVEQRRLHRALRVVLAATAVGLLTGFLGVGGGFLVVPALVLALGFSMREAAPTSLVVIAVTSLSALVVRLLGPGHQQPDWGLVTLLSLCAVIGTLLGLLLAARARERTLSTAFTVVVVLVAGYTAWQSLPALFSS